MKQLKKLPDSEFDIMKIMWELPTPITTNQIVEGLLETRGWKAPTVITLIMRLVDKDFVKTEKNGKERTYYPLITKDEYLQYETTNFLKQYHNDSFSSLISTLFDNKSISEKDLYNMIEAAKAREK